MIGGCKGMHCKGCRHSVLADIGVAAGLVALLLYVAHGRAVDHVLALAVHVALIGLAALAVLGVTALVLVAVRLPRRHKAPTGPAPGQLPGLLGGERVPREHPGWWRP